MATFETGSAQAHHFKRKPGLVVACVIAILIVALFIFSFFVDGLIRVRTERAMNEKLKGYQVTLGHAHLQFVGGALTLKNLRIVQEQHPQPPVANLPLLRFSVEWTQLLWGHVVAKVLIWRPSVHVDQTQFHAESMSKTPVSQKGWQDALENVYPFRIDRFEVDNADLTYIQNHESEPLHLTHFNLLARNIRNIQSPRDRYPSTIYADLDIFGKGKAKVDGHANFLMEPFPGVRVRYHLSDVPLIELTPEMKTLNILAKSGSIVSDGHIEYSPEVTNIRVDDGVINQADLTYFHTSETKQAELERAKTAGTEIKKQNNRRAVNIDIASFRIKDGRVAFDDRSLRPRSEFYISHLDLVAENISNHHRQRAARLNLQGEFMGVGKAVVMGTLWPTEPEFNVRYTTSHVPLGIFTPEIKIVNLVVRGGELGSRGSLEYTPSKTSVRVDDVTVDKVGVTYVHTTETSQKEAEHVTAAGEQVEKQNNRTGVDMDFRRVQIRNSNFAFDNQEMKPGWRVYLTNTAFVLENLSNHAQRGLASVDLRGDFMGSGRSTINGVFLPAMTGPELNMHCAIENTQLTSLNPVLQAYGKMEVSGGLLSVYSQIKIKNNNVAGYVKPLFANLEVYGREQEKGRPIAHQAKELAIGGAARLLKNLRTQKQASIVDISGKLKKPNMSTLQALVEVLRNAFIQAILPGFDRSAPGD